MASPLDHLGEWSGVPARSVMVTLMSDSRRFVRGRYSVSWTVMVQRVASSRVVRVTFWLLWEAGLGSMLAAGIAAAARTLVKSGRIVMRGNIVIVG